MGEVVNLINQLTFRRFKIGLERVR